MVGKVASHKELCSAWFFSRVHRASGSSRIRQRDNHHDDLICPFYFPLASSHCLVSPDLVRLLLRLSEVIPSPRCDPNLGIILLLIRSYSLAGVIK